MIAIAFPEIALRNDRDTARHHAQSPVGGRQHVGDRYKFFPRLAQWGAAALLGRVDGRPIAVAHDACDALAQPREQRIGIGGMLPRACRKVRKHGLGRRHATAAMVPMVPLGPRLLQPQT